MSPCSTACSRQLLLLVGLQRRLGLLHLSALSPSIWHGVHSRCVGSSAGFCQWRQITHLAYTEMTEYMPCAPPPRQTPPLPCPALFRVVLAGASVIIQHAEHAEHADTQSPIVCCQRDILRLLSRLPPNPPPSSLPPLPLNPPGRYLNGTSLGQFLTGTKTCDRT